MWSNHPNTSLLALSPVDTHWAFAQAKNMSPFLSSLLPFILHVRALLGAAGPWPNWGRKQPSCKVVGRQTSSDLQLGAHAIPLLLWAIKGKWERDVQIPLAILTYILSNRVERLHELTITTCWKEPTESSREGQMEGWDSGQIKSAADLLLHIAYRPVNNIPSVLHNTGSTALSDLKSYEIFPQVSKVGTPGWPEWQKGKIFNMNTTEI